MIQYELLSHSLLHMSCILRTILKSLFVLLLLSQSAISAYNDAVITTKPELETITIDGSKVSVLKGTKEPFTGTVSITNSARYDVVVKKEYVDGVADDIVVFYHSSGIKLKGEVMFPYPDGSKHSVIRLSRGILNGVSKTWYPSGILKSKTSYTVGERGDYTTYYKSGNKKQARSGSFGESEELTSWHESGERESFRKANKKGPILITRQWDSRGKKHDLWIDKYDDGSMHKSKHYTHGLPSSKWTVWHKNGNKNTEVSFSNGLLNGPIKFWNEKGILVVYGLFKDSKEVGSWEFKDHDGNSIRRPKDLHISIMDGDESINIVGHDNKEKSVMEYMEYYLSIHMTLAIVLLVSLPLLGAGV